MPNGSAIITTTLPTIVGMGVVSQATTRILGKGGRSRRRVVKSKRPRATLVVGVSPTRSGAENYAAGYRKALRSQGKPYIGRVKIKKVSGGYAALYYRG